MPTPSPLIIQLVCCFAGALTAPARAKLQTLLIGALLAPGRRTVCAALAACGLRQPATFGKYHRFFNRDRWSPLLLSCLLATLLASSFLPATAPLVVLIDETLERRRGPKIHYKGWFRDPVRSSGNRVVHSLGIRWLCACLLVSVPWSQRPWALPFWVVPVLSAKTCQRLRKRHRSSIGWVMVLITRLRRWFPKREIVLVGDGGFAAVELFHQGRQAAVPVKLICRLRFDVALYAFPEPRPQGKRGPQPKKGPRQPRLTERLTDPNTGWQRVTLTWYGGGARTVEMATGVALWYTPGQDPVPLRWVVVRPRRGERQPFKPVALGCSDQKQPAVQILRWFIARWNIEVTFAEIRAHLGFETQRHWSTRAIGRTTPCLFGLFSLVVLLAKWLHLERLPRQQSGWYAKQEATFSDALAAVRRHLWGESEYAASPWAPDYCLIPRAVLAGLRHVACYST
jgi:hypothetical protein